MATEYPDVVEEQAQPEPSRKRSTPRRQTMLDDVANDLAFWIDDTANKIALAFAPGRAPFSAQVSEQQKLEFYRDQLFNEDGSPNQGGRAKELARLGAEGFAHVYQAVVRAFPELAPKPEASPDSIDALAPMPVGPPGGGPPPGGPPPMPMMLPGAPPMPMPVPPGGPMNG